MKSFSLRRVAQYARYHYSVTRFNYIRLMLAVLACPLLFGIMNKDIQMSTSILIAIYLFAGISVAVACTHSMRGKGTKIMDGILPVSTAERHIFNMVNLCIVYPAVFALLSALSLAIVSLFNESPTTYSQCMEQLIDEALLLWPVYVLVQIICSSSLLINLLARRSLIIAYVIALIVTITLLWSIGKIGMECFIYVNGQTSSVVFGDGGLKIAGWIFKSLYIATPIVLYALSYVALRKRQVRW